MLLCGQLVDALACGMRRLGEQLGHSQGKHHGPADLDLACQETASARRKAQEGMLAQHAALACMSQRPVTVVF